MTGPLPSSMLYYSRMSSYSQTFIQMTFVRDSSNPASDDTLKIYKNIVDDSFEIRYTDANTELLIGQGSSDNRVTHTMVSLSHENVLDHIYFILKNQYLDTDKFRQIQIDPPAMPRILVDGDKFSDVYTREHVYELIGHSLECLEYVDLTVGKSTKQRNVSAARPQHMIFD